MKKETKFFSLKRTFMPQYTQESRITLANSFELPALLKRLGYRIASAVFVSKVKFSGRLKQLRLFGQLLLRIRKNHGATYVVKYLKVCQLAVQKRIAGERIESLRDLDPSLPLRRLSKCGLPAVIPLVDRRAILSGRPSLIRWWLTIFSIYRIIAIPGTLKLSTITDSFTGDKDELLKISSSVPIILAGLSKYFGDFYPHSTGKFQFLETASSTSSVSWTGWLRDSLVLNKIHLVEEFKTVCIETGQTKLWSMFEKTLKVAQWIECNDEFAWKGSKDSFLHSMKEGNQIQGGQLSQKEEAAGKVRVFAMVDVWTQSAMRVLHDHLGKILRALPNDGTYDQHASVKRCFEKSKVSGCSYGYDLSAATDRLPISLQVAVLEHLFSKEFAASWRNLLVDRAYILPGPEAEQTILYYSVGQPMGALSSWPMMALTHHLLVQYSARKVHGLIYFNKWFTGYELLGDDINIFDKEVAMKYLSVMKSIGVEINLSKSVCAVNNTFEFAKVTGHNGTDVSALSWKMFVSQNTFMGRVNTAYYLLNYKCYINKQIGGWLRNMVRLNEWDIGNYSYSVLALLTMFTNSGKLSFEQLTKAIYNPMNLTERFYKTVLANVGLAYLEKLLFHLLLNKEFVWRKSTLIDRAFLQDTMYKKIDIARDLELFLGSWNTAKKTKDLVDQILAQLDVPMPSKCKAVRGEVYNFKPATDATFNETEHMLAEFYLVLYDTVYMKLEGMMEAFWGMKGRELKGLSLGLLLKATDDVCRIKEFLDIVKRAKDKIENPKEAFVKSEYIRPSPLKAIKWHLRGTKWGGTATWISQLYR